MLVGALNEGLRHDIGLVRPDRSLDDFDDPKSIRKNGLKRAKLWKHAPILSLRAEGLQDQMPTGLEQVSCSLNEPVAVVVDDDRQIELFGSNRELPLQVRRDPPNELPVRCGLPGKREPFLAKVDSDDFVSMPGKPMSVPTESARNVQGKSARRHRQTIHARRHEFGRKIFGVSAVGRRTIGGWLLTLDRVYF